MAERPLPRGDDAKGDNNVLDAEADAGQVVTEEEEGDEDEGEEEEGDESEEEEEERVVKRKIVIVVSFGGKNDEGEEEEGESSPPRRRGPPEPRHGADVGCQVDGCDADLREAKRYHRRHRVCEGHAKAAVASVGGIDRRFCQQCSRFHELSQFDGVKRSCRNRLAGHNERRRKVPPDLKADVSEQQVTVPQFPNLDAI